MSHYGHKAHFDFLSQRIPYEFKGRRMVDLGCGDGVNTIRLKEIFRPSSIIGYDIHSGLIQRANKNGIEAYQLNLEEEEIEGELGILWGTLHHMQDPRRFLMRSKRNFSYLFIREKVSKVFFELGRPFSRQELLTLCQESLGEINVVEYRPDDHILFIFYQNRKT
ncbi:TPA: hypothetical protein DCX15_00215 [bacterium]|nr:hypothetical protein [bacterium]